MTFSFMRFIICLYKVMSKNEIVFNIYFAERLWFNFKLYNVKINSNKKLIWIISRWEQKHELRINQKVYTYVNIYQAHSVMNDSHRVQLIRLISIKETCYKMGSYLVILFLIHTLFNTEIKSVDFVLVLISKCNRIQL